MAIAFFRTWYSSTFLSSWLRSLVMVSSSSLYEASSDSCLEKGTIFYTNLGGKSNGVHLCLSELTMASFCSLALSRVSRF